MSVQKLKQRQQINILKVTSTGVDQGEFFFGFDSVYGTTSSALLSLKASPVCPHFSIAVVSGLLLMRWNHNLHKTGCCDPEGPFNNNNTNNAHIDMGSMPSSAYIMMLVYWFARLKRDRRTDIN